MFSQSYIVKNKKIHVLNNTGTRGISHVLCQTMRRRAIRPTLFPPNFEVNHLYSNEEYNQRKRSARFEFGGILFVVFVT